LVSAGIGTTRMVKAPIGSVVIAEILSIRSSQ
jgi:hypothetical protein